MTERLPPDTSTPPDRLRWSFRYTAKCGAMATMRNFECDSCEYKSRLVAGGRDGIVAGGISTISCRDCRELYDVLVYDVRPSRGPDPAEIPPSCPVSKPHTIEEWKHPGPCPRCGDTLLAGAGFALVD